MKKRRFRARWKAKKRGERNKLEQRHYDEQIKPLLDSGEYIESFYEAVSFAIQHGDERIIYTPDYFNLRKDGTIAIDECKGGIWRGDSRIRLKLAAGKFPFFDWRAFMYRGKQPPKVEVL